MSPIERHVPVGIKRGVGRSNYKYTTDLYTHTPIDGGREVTGVKQSGRTRRTQVRRARARAAEH